MYVCIFVLNYFVYSSIFTIDYLFRFLTQLYTIKNEYKLV